MTPTTTIVIANSELPEHLDAITVAIEALIATITEARVQVENGKLIELVGLDDRVGRLCSATLALGCATRLALPTLIHLTDELDTLETALKRSRHEWRPQSGTRSEPTTAPRRAAEAYSTTTSRPK